MFKIMNNNNILLKGILPYIMTKYRTHCMSYDMKYMFAGSLQPIDTQDDSNM